MRCRAAATSGLQSEVKKDLPVWFLLVAPQLALDVVEELLDRVQPRRVLSVEQHVHFKLPSRFVDAWVFVYSGVVHQDNDLFGLRVFVHTELVQCPVQEVVEHDSVGAALRYLCRYHAVVCHGCYHGERVASVLFGPFLPLQKCHLNG